VSAAADVIDMLQHAMQQLGVGFRFLEQPEQYHLMAAMFLRSLHCVFSGGVSYTWACIGTILACNSLALYC
jgi:hypothetical protein